MTAAMLQLSNAEWLEIERELCRRSLVEFIKMAWHVLEPSIPYIHGWHIDRVCEHLEAITRGDFNRLLINVPPGTMKSMITSVFWPAWEWGPMRFPSMRFIGASHEESLATRDNLKMKRLVESEWYQERWPITMTSEQNAKTYFENDKTGFRQSCPVKSMTGKRGDRVLWDDPHSAEAALSIAHRETALRVFKETLPTRLNVPEESAIVIVMQRLHEDDVSGYILAEDIGYEHLMLPMEYEPERCCYTPVKPQDRPAEEIEGRYLASKQQWFVIGETVPDEIAVQVEALPVRTVYKQDVRTTEGELLFPERFPPHVVARDKKVMGTFAVAGQNQQRPAPRSGGFFVWENLSIVQATPKLKRIVRYWDKAGTEGAGCYTAGVKMGVDEDGVYYVLHVERGQWAAPQREKVLKQTAQTDTRKVKIWIEQEPGSGGKESADATIKNLAGYIIKAERATGDKMVRAEPFAVQMEAGNVKLLEGPWNHDYIEELKAFGLTAKYKDQVDGSSGAFNKLAKGGGVHIG